MKDKVQKIREEVERRLEDAKAGVRQNQNRVKFGIDNKQDLVIWQHLESMAAQLLSFIDSLQEEPVSEELEIEVDRWYNNEAPKEFENVLYADIEKCAKHFANWQKQQDQSTIELAEDHAMLAGMEKMKEEMTKDIWKPADCDDLPEIDREVVVLTQPYPLENSEHAVSFAHRPNPDGWDGKSLTSGKVEHYTPKTYDKGGWNIPNVKYWLDVELPNE